jgi:hypothetical protein
VVAKIARVLGPAVIEELYRRCGTGRENVPADLLSPKVTSDYIDVSSRSGNGALRNVLFAPEK